MKQFKKGDAVKIIINKDKLCHDRLNGLAGTYIQETILGHFVFITDLGRGIIADDVEPIGDVKQEPCYTFAWSGICANAYTFDQLPVPTSKTAALSNTLKKNGISDDEAVKACAEAETAELKVKKRIENFSKESAPWCILPDFLRGIFEASAQPDENESKIERIERLHDAFKSAKAELDAEFKPIREVMNDLELGDDFIVNHEKDGLVSFFVTKIVAELDGGVTNRKLFVKKTSTGEAFALTSDHTQYAVKVS